MKILKNTIDDNLVGEWLMSAAILMIAFIDVFISGGLSFFIFAKYVLDRHAEAIEIVILFNFHIWLILWGLIFTGAVCNDGWRNIFYLASNRCKKL